MTATFAQSSAVGPQSPLYLPSGLGDRGRIKVFLTGAACDEHPVAVIHSRMRRS